MILPTTSLPSARSISPRWRTIPKRVRSGGRVSSASRAGLPAWERGAAARSQRWHAEIRGNIEIRLNKRVFTLRARADRIEQLGDGRYAILDYKTGQVPTESRSHRRLRRS